jgi:plasmid maintenance system killer protein
MWRAGGYWAIWVDENYRLIFKFAGKAVESVDYRDYH